MLELLNSIMLKISVGIGILSIFGVLSGMLCEMWGLWENYSNIAFKISMTGLIAMAFIALSMMSINLCCM